MRELINCISTHKPVKQLSVSVNVLYVYRVHERGLVSSSGGTATSENVFFFYLQLRIAQARTIKRHAFYYLCPCSFTGITCI